ncbi:MAG: site-specific integrase [Acidimicrobiales bacterium]
MQWVQVGELSVQRQRGKWVVRQGGYDPANGKRRVKQLATFDTKRAAVTYQRAVLDGRAGTEGETVGEFLEHVWLHAKEGRVEVATYDQYRWAVDRHIVPLIGKVRLRDLTAEVLDDWVGELVKPNDAGKPRLGATSARTVRKILSMALEEAVQRGRLPRNPVVLTQPPRLSRAHQRLGWTLEEAQQFLASVSGHRLAAAFQLSLVTGLRRGELLALRWSDIGLRAREVTVHQQLAIEHSQPVLKQLKTASADRIVTFGAATYAALMRHRKGQDAERRVAGAEWDDTGLVFTTALGGWIDPSNLGRLMDTLTDKAGVPRITPKGLRHTAQSIGRVVVGDDKVMQERLGHADIGVTLNVYTHTVTKQHKQAGARIDKAFGG